MIFAILSLVFSCVSIFAFWWLGFIGAICGIIGISTAGDDKNQKGLSIAGTIIGLLSSCIMLIIFIIL